MSSLGSAVGQAINWMSGDEGKNVVEALIKNPELQKRLDTTLGDYDKTRTASSKALDQYIKDFLSGSPAAKARSEQEQAEVDRYYNGDVERALAGLRTRTRTASGEALDRSLGYMRRAQSANLVGGYGGPSSYDQRLAQRTGADLALNSELGNLAQERADMDFLNRSKLGLAGQRTAMADALAARGFMPVTAAKGELGWNMDALRNLIGLDQANKFYGVKYDPSTGEEIGQHVGDLANAAMQAYSIYSGGLGGMGGGAATSTPWAPSTAFNAPQSAASMWSLPSASTQTIPSFNMWGSTVPGGWGARY